MSATFTETPAYRSVVRLLMLFCIYTIAVTCWSIAPYFRFMLETMKEYPLSFFTTFTVPLTAACVLLASLSHSRAGHLIRCALLGAWLLVELSYLPYIWENPTRNLTNSLIFIFDLISLILFLVLLLRRGRQRSAGQDPATSR